MLIAVSLIEKKLSKKTREMLRIDTRPAVLDAAGHSFRI